MPETTPRSAPPAQGGAFPDPVGAFVPHGRVERRPDGSGPLSGLTVAVKDLFDWEGVPTGAGNPTWLATHPLPDRDAAVLVSLLGAGATLRGKTVTDELAYSIQGENLHYGAPKNAAAAGRSCGGSSSGSAAAVAAGLVDAALGTDTGGSVRVPAAHCGLYGLRTTWGRVDTAGVVPLAPSFDTVGWLSKTLGPLGDLAGVLLPGPTGAIPRKVWTLSEATELCDEETARAVGRVVSRLGLPSSPMTGLIEEFGGLEGLRQLYAVIQGWEAWKAHGAWIRANAPVFAPAIARRFEIASRISEEEVERASGQRRRFGEVLRAAMDGGILVLPAASGPAPRLDEDAAVLDQVRMRTMRLTSPAGLGGLPQLTVPVIGTDGLPRGVGLLGPADGDGALITLAARVAEGN